VNSTGTVGPYDRCPQLTPADRLCRHDDGDRVTLARVRGDDPTTADAVSHTALAEQVAATLTALPDPPGSPGSPIARAVADTRALAELGARSGWVRRVVDEIADRLGDLGDLDPARPGPARPGPARPP
jgi:hypothetical protein